MKRLIAHIRALTRKAVGRSISLYHARKERLYREGIFSFVSSEKGFVLMVVMVISTMLISVSSDFLVNAQVNINYMKKFKNEARAETLAYAGLNLAVEILKADKRGLSIPMMPGANTNKSIDTYKDIWALDFPEITLDSGSVKLVIEDEQSKINISALSNQYVDRSPFYGILNRFFIDLGFPQDYADAVLDWVDKDESKSGNGAETYDFYSTLAEPYSAANGPFESIDQLLLVKYFTPEIFYGFGGGNAEEEKSDESITLVDSNTGVGELDIASLMEAADGAETETSDKDDETLLEDVKIGPEKSRRLDNYLRAHGNNKVFNANINKININTAPYRVLIALSDDMTDKSAKEIITKRQVTPFTKVDQLESYIKDQTLRKNCLTVNSELFRITSIGYIDNHYIRITAIYDRSSRKYLYYSVQ